MDAGGVYHGHVHPRFVSLRTIDQQLRRAIAGDTTIREEEVPTWARRPVDRASGGFSRATTEAFGWPLPALKHEVEHFDSPDGRTMKRIGAWSITFTEAPPFRESAGEVHLPLKPITNGAVANTTLFASAWFVLLGASSLSRRFARRLRQQCPACGYTLAGLEPTNCPECGRASHPSADADAS